MHTPENRGELERVCYEVLMEPRLPSGPRDPSYKVICISIYVEDLGELDQMVEALKDRGIKRASRSALIRHALRKLDLDAVADTL